MTVAATHRQIMPHPYDSPGPFRMEPSMGDPVSMLADGNSYASRRANAMASAFDVDMSSVDSTTASGYEVPRLDTTAVMHEAETTSDDTSSPTDDAADVARVESLVCPREATTTAGDAIRKFGLKCSNMKQPAYLTFEIRQTELVLAFIRIRLNLMLQNSGKKVAKLWIKGICRKKQGLFPYQNKQRVKDTGRALEIPGWWPNKDVCDFVEPDHIGRFQRISLLEHLLRLRPSVAQLREWNKSATEPNPTHATRGWTAFLAELAPPSCLDDPESPSSEKRTRRMQYLDDIYHVAALEESYEAGKLAPSHVHCWTLHPDELSALMGRSGGTKRRTAEEVDSANDGASAPSQASSLRKRSRKTAAKPPQTSAGWTTSDAARPLLKLDHAASPETAAEQTGNWVVVPSTDDLGAYGLIDQHPLAPHLPYTQYTVLRSPEQWVDNTSHIGSSFGGDDAKFDSVCPIYALPAASYASSDDMSPSLSLNGSAPSTDHRAPSDLYTYTPDLLSLREYARPDTWFSSAAAAGAYPGLISSGTPESSLAPRSSNTSTSSLRYDSGACATITGDNTSNPPKQPRCSSSFLPYAQSGPHRTTTSTSLTVPFDSRHPHLNPDHDPQHQPPPPFFYPHTLVGLHHPDVPVAGVPACVLRGFTGHTSGVGGGAAT